MAYRRIVAGSTSQIIEFPVFDSSSATGALLTGLVYNTGSLTAYYNRQNAAGAATAISLITMTKGTFSSGGFVAVDGTNMPGIYQLSVPDAALASAAGVTYVTVTLKGATNMVPVVMEIELTSVVNYPTNVTQWNGTNVASPATAGIPEVNVKNMNNVAATSITTINANQGTTQPINFTGTGASALAKVDVTDIATAAVNTASAQLGVNVVSQANIDFGALQKASLGVATALSSGTCVAGSTYTTIRLAAGEIATTDLYTGCIIALIGGTGIGQARLIAKYDGSTKYVTVSSPLVTAPDSTTTYRIYPFSGYLLADTGLAAAAAAGTITLASTAPAITDTYIGHTVFISAGTGIGQERIITAYTNTRIASISPNWTTTPDTTSVYMVIPGGRVYVNQIAASSINNAAFNDDVNTTAYATNKLALMLYTFFDNAFTGLSDGSSFTANGLLDRLTKLMWIVRNKMTVTDLTGATTIFKDDNSTSGLTTTLTDDSTTTTRLRAS